MVVIGLVAAIIVVVVIVLVTHHGSHHASPTAATTATSTTPASSTTTTGAGSTSTTATTPAAKPLAQINLTPAQAGSKAVGIAEVLQEGTQRELAIVAQGLEPNTAHNAYEVWLYNSPSDARSLGFGPVVRANGKLAAATTLPADAAHFKQLIVTSETTKRPTRPGPVVMRGQVAGLS
jgi:hypothetical protein